MKVEVSAIVKKTYNIINYNENEIKLIKEKFCEECVGTLIKSPKDIEIK